MKHHLFKSSRPVARSMDTLEARHIPLLSTPLEEKAHLHQRKTSDSDSISDAPVFKHRHESSTIELFYDLFFVANLATFTVNHDIYDGSTFRSYVGFFSLLWATWLQTSLFDVRFASDSVFNRICKALHFGVMMGFTIVGAVFSTDPNKHDKSAFRTLSIVMLVSRLTLVIQYGVVLMYVRKYNKTLVPLSLTMLVLFAAAMGYLGTVFAFNTAGKKTYYAWYVTAVAEVVLGVIISSIWRVVSFKRTHLVERVGLLTLIVIGEGILGLSKSVSYLLQSAENVTSKDIGVLVCSVLLIYFIYMLYFDQIQTERFGTIMQQLWTLMHYPLHLCILFTVEGSTNLFIWTIASPMYMQWLYKMPFTENGFYKDGKTYSTMQEAWSNSTVFNAFVDKSLKEVQAGFKESKKLYKYYDYKQNLTSLKELSSRYGSDEYVQDAHELVYEIWQGVGTAIYEVFGVKIPEKATLAAITSAQKAEAEYESVWKAFYTVFMFFYIAAGLLLVVLAILYVLGNKKKTMGEWFTVGFRVFVGAGITMALVGINFNPDVNTTFDFYYGPWHVIIVMLAYLVVIIVDNWFVQRAIVKRREQDYHAEAVQVSIATKTAYEGGHEYHQANTHEEQHEQPEHHQHH